jgi:hypothetical protein
MAVAGEAGGGGDAHQERAARAGQRGCARSAVAAQVLALNLIYLRYRHKSTHADAKCAANTHRARADMELLQVLNLLALLGQRYTY